MLTSHLWHSPVSLQSAQAIILHSITSFKIIFLKLLPNEFKVHFVGLEQDCSNSCVLAMELLQSCTKPSMWHHPYAWSNAKRSEEQWPWNSKATFTYDAAHSVTSAWLLLLCDSCATDPFHRDAYITKLPCRSTHSRPFDPACDNTSLDKMSQTVTLTSWSHTTEPQAHVTVLILLLFNY